MKILLYGVETNNKGAELMLYAILQEIERRHPEAKVYIPHYRVRQGLDYVKTSLDFRFVPYGEFLEKSHINGVIRRLGFNKIECMNYVKADYFLDASGFLFSDHCMLWSTTPQWWENVLSHQYKQGARIVFLPQAFGPFKTEKTRSALKSVGKYASLIMAREDVSYNYLRETGLVEMEKVKKFTDFTSLVEGEFPSKYEELRNGVCIIPNMAMISSGKIMDNDYIMLLSKFVQKGKESGHPVYLLNHEGPEDERLCLRCKEQLGDNIHVVSGLNALEVKGLIASAFLVVTSRFHGLASALNCKVPCLSTSWSHKYEELYKDYGLKSMVLPLDDNEKALNVLDEYLNNENNMKIREVLSGNVPKVKYQTEMMWEEVWNL